VSLVALEPARWVHVRRPDVYHDAPECPIMARVYGPYKPTTKRLTELRGLPRCQLCPKETP